MSSYYVGENTSLQVGASEHGVLVLETMKPLS